MLCAMNAPRPIPLRPDPVALRRAGINALIRTANARLLALIEGGPPENIAERNWPNDPDVGLLIKGAVSTTTTTSASALVQLTQNFVASLSPVYASAAFLQQTLQLSFDDGAGTITVGSFIADGGKAGFVKQGAPIPTYSRLVSPCMLEPSTIKTISTMTVEMVTGSNAQALIEDVLRQDVGLALDSALFDANPAVVETRPAGLRHRITALPASDATDPTDAMLADIATVAGGVAPVAGNSPITLVANPVRAIMLKLRTPRDLPVTVLASSSIAPADLVAIAPSAVVSATDGVPEISAAKATLVHQDDAPTNIGTEGSPNVVAAPTISTFQSAALALKCRMQASWSRRDDRAVAWLSATGW